MALRAAARPGSQAGLAVQVADHHGDVAEPGLGQPLSGPLKHGDRRVHERRPQGQILDRIAGQHHLGEHRDPGPGGDGPAGPLDHGFGVAVQITDGGIYLGERDANLRHKNSLGGTLCEG